MRHFILWTVLLSLAGCAGVGYREQDLKVNMVSLQLLDSTLLEQRYLVRLRVQNRSPKELEINGLSFDVELNGKDFASGVSNRMVTVPAFDETTVDVKVSSTLFGIIRQIQSMQHPHGTAFDYELSGRIHVGDGFLSIPFKESGMIDLNPPASRPDRT